MRNKDFCSSCNKIFSRRNLTLHKTGEFLCKRCLLKRKTNIDLGIPHTTFFKQMEKIREIKKQGNGNRGYCCFSKYLIGQLIEVRGKKFLIKKETYFPKEFIGIKFKLNPEKVGVIEVKK